MTEDDERNFEIIKLFAPYTIPFLFISAYTTVLLKLIESNKESTEKSIASNKESIASNKDSMEKSIASNKEIAEGQINALRDVAAAQIKAFETKFDNFYSSFSHDKTINTKNDWWI